MFLPSSAPYSSAKLDLSDVSDYVAATMASSFEEGLLGNGSGEANTTVECSNDYCISDDQYITMIEEHIFPSPYEWLLVCLHSVAFFCGLVGNALVCVAVYRNHSMRTVTNYFIVNLAVADFLVILVCLPPTVVWDITETWFLGSLLCKVILYIQSVSISVSVLTLTFISVDRWYAICSPLQFKSTTGRAKTAIALIWVISLLLVIPELIVLDMIPPTHIRIQTVYFTDCSPTWSGSSQKTYQFVLLVLLYIAPFILMSVMYCQIVRVLWRDDIPGVHETRHASAPIKAASGKASTVSANSSADCQVQSRRKAAKMLMSVVVMFGVCYFPVHMLNVLRYTVGLPNNDIVVSISLLSHWFCYINSAVNPLIYNFMSGKFRKEFKSAFLCCFVKEKFRGRTRASTNTYVCHYASAADSPHLNDRR